MMQCKTVGIFAVAFLACSCESLDPMFAAPGSDRNAPDVATKVEQATRRTASEAASTASGVASSVWGAGWGAASTATDTASQVADRAAREARDAASRTPLEHVDHAAGHVDRAARGAAGHVDRAARGAAEVASRTPLEHVKRATKEAREMRSHASRVLEDGLKAPDEEKPRKMSAKKGSKDKSPQKIDIDMDLPYGELAPFGRENTAQELTEASITESNKMVDQIEKAEVAEEQRSVFRALTRLRSAAISSFDGIANSHTENIDDYSKKNKFRDSHPAQHLADEESDVSRWAFPVQANMLLQIRNEVHH
eukprot:TRINITY_DN1920_c0_g1_i2.p1 TRINITY_DN1920_c0_g1~~TRINITY_DN1920_c0_g1_i2.p1  ORF type:complete len:309 (-),score=88.15 TRINITY_DN1920_c0_g1_i2:230-1156(-)